MSLIFLFSVHIEAIYQSQVPYTEHYPSIQLDATLDLRHVRFITNLRKYQDLWPCTSCSSAFKVSKKSLYKKSDIKCRSI